MRLTIYGWLRQISMMIVALVGLTFSSTAIAEEEAATVKEKQEQTAPASSEEPVSKSSEEPQVDAPEPVQVKATDVAEVAEPKALTSEPGAVKPAAAVVPVAPYPDNAGPSSFSTNPPHPSGGPASNSPSKEIETASFNGVTPGESSVSDVQVSWGEPKEIAKRKTSIVHRYSVDPFDQVEVSFENGKAMSIVIRLPEPYAARAVAEKLNLIHLQPVLISNTLGEILGQSFPERGVMFAFLPSGKLNIASMKVAHIILEPVTAEPFLLRAETHLEDDIETSLRDLEVTIELDPNSARAYWLKARALANLSDRTGALSAVGHAIRIEPDNPQYRVTRAKVLGQMGQIRAGIQEVQEALRTGNNRPHIHARAQCLLGDLYASGPAPDAAQALRHHTEAIKQAGPLTKDPHPALRIPAKEVLIDAHLGAAHDIAWGPWKQKEAAVPVWLQQASTFAEDLIETDRGNLHYRFRVAARALAVYVGLKGSLDPSEWTELAIKTTKEIIAEDNKSPRSKKAQWDLGMALYDAVQIHQMRGEHELALRYGQQAIANLEQGASARPENPIDTYLVGRLQFRLGAIQAIGLNDTNQAIRSFDKALPQLESVAKKVAKGEWGRLGETYVSMGVSYWQAGQHDKGMELTQRGANWIKKAVDAGATNRKALEVPYSNLATMHKKMGNTERADRFLQQASHLKKATPK